MNQINYSVEVPAPTNKIYEFRATAYVANTNSTEPLRLQNTAWSSTTVASGDFYGLVVYVGKDTRIQMNANDARVKFPICDYEINNLSKFLFLYCVLTSFFLTLLKGFVGNWVVLWVKFLVLLCCIIP